MLAWDQYSIAISGKVKVERCVPHRGCPQEGARLTDENLQQQNRHHRGATMRGEYRCRPLFGEVGRHPDRSRRPSRLAGWSLAGKRDNSMMQSYYSMIEAPVGLTRRKLGGWEKTVGLTRGRGPRECATEASTLKDETSVIFHDMTVELTRFTCVSIPELLQTTTDLFGGPPLSCDSEDIVRYEPIPLWESAK